MLYLTIIGGAFVTWLSVSVLVVDGDKHARDFVRTTLEQYGAIVVTARYARIESCKTWKCAVRVCPVLPCGLAA